MVIAVFTLIYLLFFILLLAFLRGSSPTKPHYERRSETRNAA